MGLKNGGDILQRMMEWCLHGIECADVYIDDVIFCSTGSKLEESLATHDRDVRQVLKRLKEHQLIVDPKKAHLFTTEVEFCGHIFAGRQTRACPREVIVHTKVGTPKDNNSITRFLGSNKLLQCICATLC